MKKRRECDANVKGTGNTGASEVAGRVPAQRGEERCPACGATARIRDEIRGEVICNDAMGGCGLVIDDGMIDCANPADWCVSEDGGNCGRGTPRRAWLPGERKRPETMSVRESLRRGGERDGKGVPLNGRAGRLGGASRRNEKSREDFYREKMFRRAVEEVGGWNGPMITAFSAIIRDAYMPRPDEEEGEYGKLPLNQTRHMQKVKSKSWDPPAGYQVLVSTTAALIVAGRIVGGGYDHQSAIKRHEIKREHVWREVRNITRRISNLRSKERALSGPNYDAMNTRCPEAMLAIEQMTMHLDEVLPANRRDIERVVRLAMMELGVLRSEDDELLPSVKPRALVGSLALLEFERLGIDRQKSGLGEAVNFSVTQIRNTLATFGDVLREVHTKVVLATD